MDRDRIVLGLGALAALQVLHLLDELRTDETAGLADVLLRPQPILGIGGTLVALVAVRRGSRFGRPLALTSAGLVALGFVLSHGVPGGSRALLGRRLGGRAPVAGRDADPGVLRGARGAPAAP